MGAIKKFNPENLVIGVLSSRPGIEAELRSGLEKQFGAVDYASSEIEFNFTSYYDKEMGPEIRRWFYSFEKLVDPSDLAGIKILTNEIEELYTDGKDRKVNLDPGLLDLNRLILATTKNVGHRIPLHSGIYAEVTLIYMKKAFHPLAWTYPDYQSPEYISILKDIRSLYRTKLQLL